MSSYEVCGLLVHRKRAPQRSAELRTVTAAVGANHVEQRETRAQLGKALPLPMSLPSLLPSPSRFSSTGAKRAWLSYLPPGIDQPFITSCSFAPSLHLPLPHPRYEPLSPAGTREHSMPFTTPIRISIPATHVSPSERMLACHLPTTS